MLGKINDTLLEIKSAIGPRFSGSFHDIYQNWDRKRVNQSWWYEQTITFAGSTLNVNLDFPQASLLNYVVMIFNDGTSKDFSIRVLTTPSDGYYAEVRTETSNTGTDYRTCKLEEKYPTAARLQINFSNYTVGKIVKITVQADDV